MHKKIHFTLASVLLLAGLQVNAEEMTPAMPADTGMVPAQSAATGLVPAQPVEMPVPAAMPSSPMPTEPMATSEEASSAPLPAHAHNPARDSQTDFRYCLDLPTNAEIAACRYGKK